MNATLAASGISKRFSGVVALDGVSLEVRPGEAVGLIGPNGAGKTTFFNCITGFAAPDEGSVTFDGIDLGRLSPPARARLGIGRTFQQIRLFDHLSVRENLLLGRHRRYGAPAWASLLGTPGARHAERGATDDVERIAADTGLGELLDARVGDLPYGTQRMVEVARAIAMEPSLLLLDEPGAGMDAAESAYFAEVLAGIRRHHDVAVLLIEHDVALVRALCDRIYVLDFGRLISSGRPSDVMADPAVRAAYLGTEAVHV
jgi:branched-chain amino acid transport system ATP-binding protein